MSTTPDTANDPAWPETSLEQHDRGITLRCGSAVLVVDHPDGRATLTLPPSLWAVPDAVRMFVEGVVSSLLIGTNQLHAVHSGLVVYSGKGVVLRGPSGAGKSTMTYACLRAGFAMSSDDWIYGVANVEPTRLYGYPWRMFLVPDAPRHFPELADVAAVAHPGSDRIKLPIEPPVGRRRISAHADVIVFLDPSVDLAVRPIGSGEARERFWAPALPSERSDLPTEWIDRLLDRPCYVLQRGKSPQAAAALLKATISDLGT